MNDEYKELLEVIAKIPLIGKTPDIINGFLEGDVISYVILLAKYKCDKHFEYICKCISETGYESFREINKYMLDLIADIRAQQSKRPNKKLDDNYYTDYHIDILTKYL